MKTSPSPRNKRETKQNITDTFLNEGKNKNEQKMWKQFLRSSSLQPLISVNCPDKDLIYFITIFFCSPNREMNSSSWLVAELKSPIKKIL